MNVLPTEKRLRVLAALVDGNSERAVERMTEVNRKTVGRFALTLGRAAENLHNARVRDLSCSMIQLDEIWSFVKKKQARVDPSKDDPDRVGEAYTFTALDVSSRLVFSFRVGKRNQETAHAFVSDARSRLVVMPSISSDGFSPYIFEIGYQFGPVASYAQMKKNYTRPRRKDDKKKDGEDKGGKEPVEKQREERRRKEEDRRYEPQRNPFITKKRIYGTPDMDKVSTAYMERNNGTMRHHIGRMRRLCYAFSKDLDHHRAAVALCYVHYNFCHVVSTLRVTPAMAAGLTDHIWELDELLDELLAAEPCALPEKKPLLIPVPETTSRPLPNGRGFLRVVGAPSSSPAAPADPATAVAADAASVTMSTNSMPPPGEQALAASVPAADDPQLNLFAWGQRRSCPLPPPGAQLSLFGPDPR